MSDSNKICFVHDTSEEVFKRLNHGQHFQFVNIIQQTNDPSTFGVTRPSQALHDINHFYIEG